MEFPRLVYKDGGPHQRMGGTFDYVCVEDEAQHAERLADGWFDTVGEAIAAPAVPKAPPDDDTKPPTRAEIEQKLGELGVTFDKRLGTAKLTTLLDAALKARP